jgi:hypothetical protein
MMLYEVILPNGSKAMVDKRTAASIEALRDLQLELGQGLVANLFVARTLVSEDSAQALLTFSDTDKLPILSKTLGEFSKRCERQAAIWEGNAPATNRSDGVQ